MFLALVCWLLGLFIYAANWWRFFIISARFCSENTVLDMSYWETILSFFFLFLSFFFNQRKAHCKYPEYRSDHEGTNIINIISLFVFKSKKTSWAIIGGEGVENKCNMGFLHVLQLLRTCFILVIYMIVVSSILCLCCLVPQNRRRLINMYQMTEVRVRDFFFFFWTTLLEILICQN